MFLYLRVIHVIPFSSILVLGSSLIAFHLSDIINFLANFWTKTTACRTRHVQISEVVQKNIAITIDLPYSYQ